MARPLPAGRADEARGPRRSRAAWASSPPTSPRARRSASSRAATTATSCVGGPAGRPRPGPVLDADGTVVGEHRGCGRLHRGPAQGPGRGARRAALRAAHRRRRRTSSSSGRREDLETQIFRLEALSFVAGEPPAGGRSTAAFRAAGPDPASRGLVDAPIRPAAIRGAAADTRTAWIVETDAPVWAAAPGQACALYDGDVCLGGGRIAAPTAGLRDAGRATRPGALAVARMTIGPGAVLALLVGVFHTRALRRDPRRRRRPPAAHVRRRGAGRLGRRCVRRPPGRRSPLARRLPAPHRVAAGLGGDRVRRGHRHARPAVDEAPMSDRNGTRHRWRMRRRREPVDVPRARSRAWPISPSCWAANRRTRSASCGGLAIGALVGAAIAGSTIWQRRRRGKALMVEPAEREALIEQYADGADEVERALRDIGRKAFDQRPAGRLVERARDRPPPRRQRDDVGDPRPQTAYEDDAVITGYDEAGYARFFHYADRPMEPALERAPRAPAPPPPSPGALDDAAWARTRDPHGERPVRRRGLAADLRRACPRARRPDPPRRRGSTARAERARRRAPPRRWGAVRYDGC